MTKPRTRRGGWFTPLCLGLMVLLCALAREGVIGGFRLFYNDLARTATANSGIVTPLLSTTETTPIAFYLLVGIGAAMIFRFLAKKGILAVFLAILCGIYSVFPGECPTLLPVLCALLLLLGGKRSVRKNLIPAGIILLLLLSALLPGVQSKAGEWSTQLRTAIHAARYETSYTTLPEGRDPYGELPNGGTSALVVTMEQPETLYLRGFTGAVLEDTWQPLDNALLAEHQELLYWLSRNDFDLHAQFSAACGADVQTNRVTVQNLGGCSAWRYLPCTVIRDDSFVAEELTDAIAANGQRYDSFTTVYRGTEQIPELLDTLNGSDTRYRRAEAAYREFVYTHYLTLPEDVGALAQHWSESSEPQEAVRSTLEALFPEGPEHSPHYATTAVLTLRHYGIPARYAEGYIVPESKESTINAIPACWAEVYQDGLGWVPMAQTPGTTEEILIPEEAPIPPTEATVPDETTAEPEPDPSGGYQVLLPEILKRGLPVSLVLLLLLITALLLRRKYILRKRAAFLKNGDIREVIGWCMADAVSHLGCMGIRRGNGSLYAMLPPIRGRFGAEYVDLFARSVTANQRALFSDHEISEEERKLLLGLRAATLEYLNANTTWVRRLWLQWIECQF